MPMTKKPLFAFISLLCYPHLNSIRLSGSSEFHCNSGFPFFNFMFFFKVVIFVILEALYFTFLSFLFLEIFTAAIALYSYPPSSNLFFFKYDGFFNFAGHPSNAHVSINVTLSGIVIFFSNLQFLNAQNLIFFNLDGSFMLVRAVHSRKASSSIYFKPLLKFTAFNSSK